MDVNGLPFRLVTGAGDFGFSPRASGARVAAHLAMSSSGHLTLASEQQSPAPGGEDEMFARTMVGRATPVADKFGGFAWWDTGLGGIAASGFLAGSVPLKLPPPSGVATVPSALMLGEDDVLYAARGGAVIWHDLRERWPDTEVSHARYKADLLAPTPGSGGWAFDRTNRRLLRLRGRPLRFAGLRDPDAAGFGPVEPNRDPPRIAAVARGAIDARFDAVALAGSPGGRLALLAWESGADAALFIYGENGLVEFGRLAGLRFPWGLAWDGEDRVAVMAASGAAPARQAFVYDVAGAPVAGRTLNPEGRIHPLLDPWNGGFCNALGPVPRHLQADSGEATPRGLRPLRALSGSSYAGSGQVLIGPIDGLSAGCAWHRLYAEAALVDHTAIDLQLFASDELADPAMPAGLTDPDWALHRLLPHRRDDTPAGTPVGAWQTAASEVPFAAPVLACPPRIDKAGLFTALIQHAGRRVRRLTGRYLWIVATLSGDTLVTPELAALRIYAHRLSWRDKYLPGFYGETLSGSDASAVGPATRHDFMERMLLAHEGALTEIEGRIASAWELTDPASAPDGALPWLGSWIGQAARPGEATSRQRQRLIAAPHLAPMAGTLGGLTGALELATGGAVVRGGRLDPGEPVPAAGTVAIARDGDVAIRALMLAMETDGTCVFLSGGAVSRGDIVVIEGFRLRRTFATILGADLFDEDDPLTLGMGSSGNSFVGDTLILGDEARDELLALYAPEIDATKGDTAAVAAFYAELAWRVLVLVRGVSDADEFRRLSDLVTAEVPAHVLPQVLHASNPLIIGAASLVGIDTWLAPPEPFHRVRLGHSALGEGDFVAGSGRLDPRADGPVPGSPTAHIDGPTMVWAGNSFTLSGAASRAAARAQIERYIWTWQKEN
jgi:phage tail-like protein